MTWYMLVSVFAYIYIYPPELSIPPPPHSPCFYGAASCYTFLAGLELTINPGLPLIQDPSTSASSEGWPSACFNLCFRLLMWTC